MSFNPKDYIIKIRKYDPSTKQHIMVDYLEAKWRMVWFREEHPDWVIETEVEVFPKSGVPEASLARAVIRDADGQVKAVEWGYEEKRIERVEGGEKVSVPNSKFVEKSVTTAIARALAQLGYGTAWARELDEGQNIEELSDSPVSSKDAPEPITPAQKDLLRKLKEERPEVVASLLGKRTIDELTKAEAHKIITSII